MAAILAVALLLLASVRSTVMQAGMATAMPMPECGAGLRAGDMGRHGPSAPDASHKACPYCAAAAHAPVCASPRDLAEPAQVAWLTWRPLAALGPRGPPAVQPRARGPPTAPLIA